MKKKSTSQSAFLNPRVLFGLLVMLAGVFLALVSFGTFSSVFAQNQGGTTREEMTLTLAQALGAFQPPACVPGAEMFNDVPASSPFCPFIEELARRGITGGCAPNLYCPNDPVTRQQMAVFLLKATEAALSGPLASGDTLRGYWATAGHKVGGGFVDEAAISFQIPLNQAPQTQFVPDGGPPTAECPGSVGTPLAAPGFLCFYANDDQTNVTGLDTRTTLFGARFFATGVPADSNYEVEGTWAVTAP
jgi:S-layer homology domain